MEKFDQLKYIAKYQKQFTKRYTFTLNEKTDQDLINELAEDKEPMATKVKRLLREDMLSKKNKFN